MNQEHSGRLPRPSSGGSPSSQHDTLHPVTSWAFYGTTTCVIVNQCHYQRSPMAAIVSNSCFKTTIFGQNVTAYIKQEENAFQCESLTMECFNESKRTHLLQCILSGSEFTFFLYGQLYSSSIQFCTLCSLIVINILISISRNCHNCIVGKCSSINHCQLLVV